MKPADLKPGQRLIYKGNFEDAEAFFIRRQPAGWGRPAINYVRIPKCAGLNGSDDDGTCSCSDHELKLLYRMADAGTQLTWHAITGTLPADLPDADLEVLVYDADLDDTVIAALDYDGERMVWVESTTRQPLPRPKFWADKPYPDPESKLCHPLVRVGKFTLCKTPFGKTIWIQSETGEGGEFPAKDIEQVLEAFYRERF